MKKYYKISIICTNSNLDTITGLINFKLNINNFEIIETNMTSEINIYIDPKIIKLYSLKNILKIINPYTLSYNIKTINYDKKIESSYKKYFKSNKVCKNIIIKPSWIKSKKLIKDEIIISIDPGLAFGTGLHESTKGVIRLLNKYKKNFKLNYNILDAGTGSGILSIVAHKLGFKNILAIDNDFEAIKVAKENFKINKTIDIKTRISDLNNIKTKFNIILANIISNTLIENYNNFIKISKKDAIIFMSGILFSEQSKILDVFLKENRFKLIKVLKLKEWVSIVLKKN